MDIMNLNAIILTNTSDLYYYGLTCRTINSLRNSDNQNIIDITVIETQPERDFKLNGFIYDECNTIFPNQKFNYNKFLNIGLENTKADWILICNNDLFFTKDWLSNITDAVKNNPDVLSFSPISPSLKSHIEIKDLNIIEGYQVSNHICGWCILLHRSVIDTCELFDEQFEFWCQDDDYAEELKKHNMKHALVPSSRVYHMENSSHKLLGDSFNELTAKQQEKFFKKWGK
jgi:hypothetical protein